jgi:hypothetical protein
MSVVICINSHLIFSHNSIRWWKLDMHTCSTFITLKVDFKLYANSGLWNNSTAMHVVDCFWNVMAHAQKPDFVFWQNGWVHLSRRGCQFSRILAAEMCASAVVTLDTPCAEVVWRVLATHSICQFPLQFPFHALPCAITFQLDSTNIFYVSKFQVSDVIFELMFCMLKLNYFAGVDVFRRRGSDCCVFFCYYACAYSASSWPAMTEHTMKSLLCFHQGNLEYEILT